MLRYKTKTRPGLVALYDIRPGNGAVHSYNPGARTGPNDTCLKSNQWSYCTRYACRTRRFQI